jgi:hypothetical protein
MVTREQFDAAIEEINSHSQDEPMSDSCPNCEEAEQSEDRRAECWLERRKWLEENVISKPHDHSLWNEYQAFLEDVRRRGDL